jgi:RimJ/RimL family protein N-acetyltransferase/catechol 2,3-dioxygenase-like lactoylglutathione lyase family enzyme
MQKQPVINTDRLILRPFAMEDAADVQKLAGEKEIADTTLLIPHPYPDGAAEEWISSHETKFNNGEEIIFAITLKNSKELIGAIGLVSNKLNNSAEVGYWIGKPYWNTGYCTEALNSIIKYGFDKLALNKIHAHHMTKNEASGEVMIKTGMKREGLQRKHIIKNGVYEDIVTYGILKQEYPAKSNTFTVDQLDHVELFVPARYEAAKWYEQALGLRVVKEYKHWAKDPHGPLMISPDNGSTKLALFTGTSPGTGKRTEFNVVAFRVSGNNFIRFVKRCDNELELYNDKRDRITSKDIRDHGKVFSIYFNDPFGHKLEVTTYDYDYVKSKLPG